MDADMTKLGDARRGALRGLNVDKQSLPRHPMAPGRRASFLVDAHAGLFEVSQHLIKLGRVAEESLHALHAFIGHFLGRVTIVELGDAALGIREDFETLLGKEIVRYRRLIVGRQRPECLGKTSFNLGRADKRDEASCIGFVLRFRWNVQAVRRAIFMPPSSPPASIPT